MTTDTKLYARAILLEEYRNGTTVEKAMEKVHAELGPNAISRENINHWFKAFKCGCEKIAHTADGADRCLIENGTFLRSKRSLLSGLHSSRKAIMCNTYGTNRFQFFRDYYDKTNWIVDTFNGTTKKIHIDFSAIDKSINHRCFILSIIYYIEHPNVCGVMYRRPGKGRMWFKGKFDHVNFVLCIEMVKSLSDIDYTLDTQAQPPALKGFSGNLFYSHTVDLANGSLSEVNTTNMRYEIWSPIIRNGKLFGFPYAQDRRVNTKKLFEISLVDRSKIEHEIEDKSNLEILNGYIPSLWTNDHLLVGAFDYHNEISTIFKFDISQMKWKKTTIGVGGRIISMTVADGRLTAHGVSLKDELYHLYRFQYEAVDSLANLVWLSMQRYSLRNPSFHEWFLSKLPKNHRFRSLWN